MKALKFGAFFGFMTLTAVAASAAVFVVGTDEDIIRRSDVIVIARATASHVDSEQSLNTITSFAVEEVLEGDPSLIGGLEVREPGGSIVKSDGRTIGKFVPGTPRFVDGERVLLLLKKVSDGKYAVAELALGFFKFSDHSGGPRLIRPLVEGHSWTAEGKQYREPIRDAERFLAYVREIAKGRPVAPNYILAPDTTLDTPRLGSLALRPGANATYSISQYTMVTGGNETLDLGYRWGVTTVNWNRGNVESNAPNGGSDAINNAFSQWQSGSSMNYVLASTTANSTGVCGAACGEPDADSVNNVSFEENLTGVGIAAYVCNNANSTIAVGGITAFLGTHTFNTEMFNTTTETDVSFNQGVNTCLGTGQLTTTNFNLAMTHELGHTLDIRHSDRTRTNLAACTTQANYDCSDTAVMREALMSGTASLQPWDLRAIGALYPPLPAPNAPTNVSATASSSTSVSIVWTAPTTGATVAKYHVYRCSTAGCASFVQVAETTTTSFTDTTVFGNTAYVYKVRAVNSSNGESADSDRDLATTTIFTDPTITAGASTVRGLHITDLRTAVTAVCTLANNPAPCGNAFTDPSITQFSTSVKAAHINELRARLDAARSALLLSAWTYTDSPTVTANTTIIKRMHIIELRAGVQ